MESVSPLHSHDSYRGSLGSCHPQIWGVGIPAFPILRAHKCLVFKLGESQSLEEWWTSESMLRNQVSDWALGLLRSRVVARPWTSL